MRAFEYVSPTTKEQAVELLGRSFRNAEILAGGIDLLSLMKDDVVAPKMLVNIKGITELDGITFTRGGALRIGALTTIQELVDSPMVRQNYPVIVHAAEGIASPQIRNMGTVGGNLCQRPRCWYYRAGFGLLAKNENGESLVTRGDNRYHAILGNSGPAYFVSPSSLAPALIALGATARIFGPKGAREVPLDKFYITPKSNDEREYDLKPNEFLTEIMVPGAGRRSATYEVRQKEAVDWPLATACVVLQMNGREVKSARVVLGHVAPVPWPSPAAEQALIGKEITEDVAAAAGNAAVEKATSLGGNKYKIQLARIAVKRAVLAAAKGGGR